MGEARRKAMAFASELAGAYPGNAVSRQTLDAYRAALDDIGLDIADDVSALLRVRSTFPPSVAQIYEAAREVRKETRSPRFDPSFCTFADGIPCRQCSTPDETIVHGHLIEPAVGWHGLHHLVRHFDGESDQLEMAKFPERCDCDYVAPPNADFETAVKAIYKALGDEYHSPLPRYRERIQW